MKKLILTALLAIIGTSTSFAGNSSGGGGGFVIQCKNSDGKLTSTLADLWMATDHRTGSYFYDQELMDVEPSDTLDSLLNKVVDKAGRINKTMGEILKEAIDHVKQSKQYIGEGEQLVLNNDTEIVSLPKSCKLVPVARFMDRYRILYVDRAIESQMDVLNRAALIVHEAIYYLRRNTYGNDSTSFMSQYQTAILFSKDYEAGANLKFMSDTMLCNGVRYIDKYALPSSFIIGINETGELVSHAFANSVSEKDFNFAPYIMTEKLYPSFYEEDFVGSPGSEQDVNGYLVKGYRQAVAKNEVNDFVNYKIIGEKADDDERIGGAIGSFNCSPIGK